MGRKSMVGKTSCACTVVAKIKKIIISSNFSLKLLLTVIEINFLPESLYICLKKHQMLCAKYNLQSERTFETPCRSSLSFGKEMLSAGCLSVRRPIWIHNPTRFLTLPAHTVPDFGKMTARHQMAPLLLQYLSKFRARI